ncbi:MAG: IS1634 family transposase, partial [Bacteroidetes bacterium]
MCDQDGDPISIEVFDGNTQDPKTFASQIKKAAEQFGCQTATFVGDRGMIKNVQIDELPEEFHYITAITKPQIQTLIKNGLIEMDFFDEKICEVQQDGLRYILKRNPIRVAEINDSRLSKKAFIENMICDRNIYLKEHQKAKPETALKKVH